MFGKSRTALSLKLSVVMISIGLMLSSLIEWRARAVHTRVETVQAKVEATEGKVKELWAEVERYRHYPDSALALRSPLVALGILEGLVRLADGQGNVLLKVFPRSRLMGASVQERVASFLGLREVGYIPFEITFTGTPWPVIRQVWLGVLAIPATVEGLSYRSERLRLSGKIYVRKTR